MPTERPRITITMPEERFKQVQDFQFGNKMKNQTQAILYLIEKGFEELQKTQDKKEAPTSGGANIDASNLSTEERIRIMLKQFGMLDESENLSDDDLAFLQHMFLAIQAYFQKS